MPSATPLPRGPSRLTLYGAGDLLNSAGCPVCGYVAEAAGRFYSWFALEAHAEPATITRLCDSLGLCPRHTRGLLGQPGADRRLTVVYRHVLAAARAHLAAGTSSRASCPACARETAAADRCLDTLLTGLREQKICHLYREHRGLCLPHLGDAAARGRRQQAAWMARTALVRLAAGALSPAALAGEADPDADVRARLRAALPVSAPGLCVICLAAGHAERHRLVQIIAGEPDPIRPGVCPPHLQDALATIASTASPPWPPSTAAVGLLARQAEEPMAWLRGLAAEPTSGAAVRALMRRRRNPPAPMRAESCPACTARAAADLFHAKRLRGTHRTSPVTPPEGLCLCHVMALREPGQRAADAAVRMAIRGVDLLVAELDEAFRKRMWAHRHEIRGPEMTAWQRAAAFLDGRVYGGGPPAPL